MSTKKTTPILAALGAVAFVGCEHYADIDPAPAATTPARGEVGSFTDAAVSNVEDVKVVASAERWEGDALIREEVTPFRVHIDNDSKDHVVRVDYQSFYLVNSKGKRYQALPPFEMEGDAPTPRPGAYTGMAPTWTGRNYGLYDVYSPIYTGYGDIYGGPFYYDNNYYDYYYGYWGSSDLPTDRMLAAALPEGVVRPGGEVKGWLYFEEIDADDDERLWFRADLVEADTGRRIGQVSLPFTVEEL